MNALNDNIDGKTVIARGERFHCTGGFGAHSFTMGTALMGFWVETGKADRIDGMEVLSFAQDQLDLAEQAKQAVQKALDA